MTKQTEGKTVFIKYQNRKIYDTSKSKYVNLTDIAKLPTGSFLVMDYETKGDITDSVLLGALTSHFENNPESFDEVKEELITRFLGK